MRPLCEQHLGSAAHDAVGIAPLLLWQVRQAPGILQQQLHLLFAAALALQLLSNAAEGLAAFH